jgi:hypothetical protein
MVGASSDIQNVLINGHAIDLNSIIIPPQVFKKGANEVIYYSTKIQDSTHSNLTFTTFKPFFLKTTVKANENSIVKPMIRGARALVYINGSFAGLCQSEYAEALGYGLFQNGENEITLCLLQNSPQTFVESLNIATANDQHSLVLPWAKIKDDEKRPSFVFGPGPKQAYQGTLLSRTSKNDTFTAGLNLTATPNQDLQLTFNDSNRLSEWKFAQEFSAPYILYLNGKKILRKGASFTLPKELLSKTNNLRFESHGLKIPEPILYLKKAPTSPISPRLTLVKRRGQPRLNEETFFVGESLSWDLNFDPSSIDQVFISKNGIVTEIASKSLLQNPKIHLTLKNTEAIELKVWATQNDKEIFSFNRKILPVIFPKNPNGWLRAHGQNQIVSLSDQAFFESESNLFPEKFASEWLKRELYSDGDELQFGPLKEWSTKRKFSIYEFLPNGEAVFDKFYNRLNTYIKIQSRGLPTRFIMKSNTSAPELWKSAAFVFHYLKWLESQGQSVSWDLPTLEAYNTKYIAGLEAKAAEFVKIRKMTINNLVKQMTLTAALGSTFEEED